MKPTLFLCIGLLCALVLLNSCEPRSYDEYALTEYDGDLTWTRITKNAAWANRYDHKVVVYNNELWLMGGYTPGNMRGDSYFEDVWHSSDGVTWESATTAAPWRGRRGHEVVVFDDGSGSAMFLIGGFSSNEDDGSRMYNNDVWKSTDGIHWEEIKPTVAMEPSDTSDWAPRSNHRVVVMSDSGTTSLLLIGGQTLYDAKKPTHAIDYFQDAWSSTDGRTWERLSTTEFGIRAEHAMCVSSAGTIYLQGGMHGDNFETEDNASMPLPEWDHLWVIDDRRW